MLTTRCPDCQTTFRITSNLLHTAAGQVRCGQCSAVFDAFVSLTDTTQRSAHDTEPRPEAQTMAEEPLQEEQLQEEPAAAENNKEVAEDETAAALQTWHPVERPVQQSHGWRLAAAFGALVLMLQALHHFRGAVVDTPYIGDYLEDAYALAGVTIPLDTDPENFVIVDWVATAQESDDSQPGILEISAGIHNKSGTPLGYPMLSLELTDRWEKVIGARVFAPAEYLGRRLSDNAKIRPNATVMAQLQLVDPGPDAYGFEVDVCVAIDSQNMRCKTDAVFE